MRYPLRKAKAKQLEYCEQQLKESADSDVIGYYQRCIYVLNCDLNLEKDYKIIEGTEDIKRLLRKVFSNEDEVNILSIIFSNPVIPAAVLSIKSKLERGKVYRICNKFKDENIISTTSTDMYKYFVLNKSNPFGNMISKKKLELEKLEKISKEIGKILEKIGNNTRR